jgi:hypothetical protein
MYFINFPSIYYPFNINGKEEIKVVKDITRNVRVIKEIASKITLFELYDIMDGDTPEIISEKFYGTPLYHWALMIINARYDYISDFPLSQPALDLFVTQKYGEGHENDVHHWIDLNGYICSSDISGATSVSNTDYEESVNESKRTLKIVSPELMSQLVDEFQRVI